MMTASKSAVASDLAWRATACKATMLTFPGLTKTASGMLEQLDTKLMGGVPAQHPCDHRFRHGRPAQLGDRVPGARRVVMRVARPPDHLRGEIGRQLLNEPLLGVEPEHDVAVLPHLLGLGADR